MQIRLAMGNKNGFYRIAETNENEYMCFSVCVCVCVHNEIENGKPDGLADQLKSIFGSLSACINKSLLDKYN